MTPVTVNSILNGMSDEQKFALYYLVGYALETGKSYLRACEDVTDEYRVKSIYKTFTDEQKAVTKYLLAKVRKERKCEVIGKETEVE